MTWEEEIFFNHYTTVYLIQFSKRKRADETKNCHLDSSTCIMSHYRDYSGSTITFLINLLHNLLCFTTIINSNLDFPQFHVFFLFHYTLDQLVFCGWIEFQYEKHFIIVTRVANSWRTMQETLTTTEQVNSVALQMKIFSEFIFAHFRSLVARLAGFHTKHYSINFFKVNRKMNSRISRTHMQ